MRGENSTMMCRMRGKGQIGACGAHDQTKAGARWATRTRGALGEASHTRCQALSRRCWKGPPAPSHEYRDAGSQASGNHVTGGTGSRAAGDGGGGRVAKQKQSRRPCSTPTRGKNCHKTPPRAQGERGASDRGKSKTHPADEQNQARERGREQARGGRRERHKRRASRHAKQQRRARLKYGRVREGGVGGGGWRGGGAGSGWGSGSVVREVAGRRACGGRDAITAKRTTGTSQN